MRLNLNVINDELAKLGYTARLDKGDGYFYFRFGEAADWLDCKVRVRTINTLTMKQWIAEFGRLKALNEQILSSVKPGRETQSAHGERRQVGKPKQS